MTEAEFESKLHNDGYREVMTRRMEPRPANAEHTHEFSVRGLVLAGEFIISSAGVPRSYRAGDVFEVAAGQPHSEAVGSDGASLMTGRLYR
jgi:quercetin dioxygenase-like cupin family protein